MLQDVMSSMEFAGKVQLLLDRYRMSQADLAKAVGTHQPQVSKWLNSGTIPTMPLALRVARALHVPLDYLMDDELDEPPQSEELPPDEAKVLGVYRSLKRTGSLDEDEAVTGLASAAKRGVAWIPGSVRDLTPPAQTPRGRQRPRGEAERPAEWAPGQRLEDEPKNKGGRKPAG